MSIAVHAGPVRARPLPLVFRTTSFTVEDAVRNGIPVDRLRGRDLLRPTRSLRVSRTSPLDTVEARARALRPLLSADQWFSHTTAAVLWGLPLPRRLRDDLVVHVTGRGGRQMRRPGVVGHRTLVVPVIGTAHGLPASDPIRTWLDCASVLSVRELVVMGDQLVARWCTIEDLSRAVGCAGGIRGISRLRVAVERVRVGSESPMETELRLVLVDHGLPEPLCNTEVRAADGRFLGRVDLAYPELRLAIEYEGRHHQEDRRTYLRDIDRRERFELERWVFVLVADRDLADEERLVGRVRRRIAERANAQKW
jgi:hypothetical protein